VAIWPSRRASGAPRQSCTPCPRARWRLGSPVITVGGGYDGKHQFATRNCHSRNCHILTRVTLRCRFQRAIEAHLQSTPDHLSGSKIELDSLGWEGHGHSNCLPCAIAAHPSDLAVRDLSPRPRRGATRRWRRPLWWRALFRQTLRRGHAGAHFGWLHFGFGKHSARHAGSGAPTTSDTSPHLPSHLWNFGTAARMSSVPRIPPTLLWSPPLFQTRPNGRVSFVSSAVRPRRGFFFNRFPCFSSSGCFFNGVTQVCFFEPFLPLLSFSGAFDPFHSGFGSAETRLISATTSIPRAQRSGECPRSRPLPIHRITTQQKGIRRCTPEPRSAQRPKTGPWARESSCWC
jgi:hypothetical protein